MKNLFGKIILTSLVVMIVGFAHARSLEKMPLPDFSAFVKGKTLFVTILADTCNHYSASLEVDGLCREDRVTKNMAYECGAKLQVTATEMYCGPETEPKVLSLDLAENLVASEARILNLTYIKSQVQVRLKK